MAVPKCPKCSTELRDDYGMVTCPSCGAIVFVDMDGNAHVAGEGESSSAAEAEAPSFEAIPAEPFSAEPIPSEPASFEAPLAPMDMPMEASPPAADPVSTEPAASGEIDMNAFLGYGGADAGSPPSTGGEPSQNDPGDPLGISAYANSELSAAKDGPLVVSLIISGIDAKDLRDEIREALQDSRFGWDAIALMSTIKGGVLRIDRISPVKATVIVNRIKNLSVQIRWEQNAITEIDPAEKET